MPAMIELNCDAVPEPAKPVDSVTRASAHNRVPGAAASRPTRRLRDRMTGRPPDMPWSIPDAAYDQPIVWKQSLRGCLGYVGDPELAAHILVRNVDNYPKDDVEQRRFSMLFGSGLLGTEGAMWKRHRRALAASFSPRSIERYADRIAGAVRPFVGLWRAQSPGQAVDMSLSMTLVSLNLITGMLVRDDAAKLIAAILAASPQIPLLRERSFWDYLPLPAKVKIAARARAACAVRAEIDQAFAPIRQELDLRIGTRRGSAAVGDDILGAILASGSDNPSQALDDAEIRDELLTLFFAGHDTTAVTLAWVWYLLAAHPEWARAVEREADRSVVDDDVPPDNVPSLACIRAVALECMRLLPAVPSLSHRVAIERDQWKAVVVPHGARMIISPWLMGRHRGLWREPERFDPARFLDRGADEEGWAFSAGRRICIGKGLALREVVVVIAIIAKNFRFELASNDVPGLKYNLVMRPDTPIKLKVFQR